MTKNKLQSLFNFLAVLNVGGDDIISHSPDYIIEKFERYINTMDTFDMSTIPVDISERKFLNDYHKLWGDVRSRTTGLSNILVYVFRSNWMSGTLPSIMLSNFLFIIGDYDLIKEPSRPYSGIHENLKTKFFEDTIYDFDNNGKLGRDLKKLYREFNIDNILENE